MKHRRGAGGTQVAYGWSCIGGTSVAHGGHRGPVGGAWVAHGGHAAGKQAARERHVRGTCVSYDKHMDGTQVAHGWRSLYTGGAQVVHR